MTAAQDRIELLRLSSKHGHRVKRNPIADIESPREALEQAMRANRSALSQAESDIRDVVIRLAACGQRIAEQVVLKQAYEQRSLAAPALIERLKARLVEQERELAALGVKKPSGSTTAPKIGMKQVCELLGRLMSDPTTMEQGKQLL